MSPYNPVLGSPSLLLPPVMRTLRYTTAGESSVKGPSTPPMPALRSTEPAVPNPAIGSPVRASSASSRPSSAPDVDARRQRPGAGPVRDAAPADPGPGVVPPHLLAGLRLEGEDAGAAGHVHQAIDDGRRPLQIPGAGVERPRLPQRADVVAGDLRQREKRRAPGSPPGLDQPVSLATRRRQEQDEQSDESSGHDYVKSARNHQLSNFQRPKANRIELLGERRRIYGTLHRFAPHVYESVLLALRSCGVGTS